MMRTSKSLFETGGADIYSLGFADHFITGHQIADLVQSGLAPPAFALASDPAARSGLAAGEIAVSDFTPDGAVTTPVPSATLASAADTGELRLIFGGLPAAGLGAASGDFSLMSSVAIGADLGKLQFGLAELFIESQSALSLSALDPETAMAGFQSQNELAPIFSGFVAIDAIAADGDGAALLERLEGLGLKGGMAFGAMVGGYIPLDSLDELAALDTLKAARPAYMITNAGAVHSQDDPAMRTDDLRAGYDGLDGSGLRIGILSDSFDTRTVAATHYSDNVASGDLPAGVHILLDSATPGTDEGRGMAELIYDVAPGVAMSFHTANGGQAVFAAGIAALAADGADVIVDDVIYFAEPFFQDGIVAQAVDAVVGAGVTYFSSAGNSGSRSYQSAFVNSGQTITVNGTTYQLHDFDTGATVDTAQQVRQIGSVSYILQWDQPFFSVSPGSGGSANDLALIIRSATTGAVLFISDVNNLSGDPIEIVGLNSTGVAALSVSIGLKSGAQPGLIKYVMLGGDSVVDEYATRSPT
ncbi:MAG TPA: hypothetical protein VFR28_00305, partial [Allosphingosinicella sp.]|nr:hypothetical protein [Allosphingosinicella sp.]